MHIACAGASCMGISFPVLRLMSALVLLKHMHHMALRQPHCFICHLWGGVILRHKRGVCSASVARRDLLAMGINTHYQS